MIPSAYYSSWRAVSRESPGIPDDSVYCPGINTAELARLYGVSFVLERAGTPGPRGGVFDRVGGRRGSLPDPGCRRRDPHPTGGRRPTAGRRRSGHARDGDPPQIPRRGSCSPDADSPQILRLRLTDVPGWHASIDGRPVPLQHFAGVMLQVEVPAGRHTIELNYWPATFTIGLVLAGCAALGLAGAFALTWNRDRHHDAEVRLSSGP